MNMAEQIPPIPNNKKEEAAKTPEQQMEIKESPETVRELLDQWVNDYETTPDGELKKELAYKILKMTMALSESHLKAENVKICESQDGTLGIYEPESKEVFITSQGLELPPEHFIDVLKHESAHAGKMTGHRIMDESLAEWYTIHHLSGALGGYYQEERARAVKAFGEENMDEAIEKYDFDRPLKLVRWFLEIELADRLKNEEVEDERRFVKHELKQIRELFKKAVPDLYGQLEKHNFKFEEESVETVEDLAKAA